MQTLWIQYYTLFRKEVVRFMRIWKQTLVPPLINQTLYFVIFGAFIGSQVRDIGGVSYMAFIVPGLVMMAVINSAYVNIAGSFFGSKFQRNIDEMFVSHTPKWVIVAGYVTSSMLRGIMVGFIVFLVSFLFIKPEINNLFLVILFVTLTSFVFSLAGLINGIYAKKFDDVSIIPTFIITPLVYFGGVFYSIKDLPEVWQTVSQFNPILYMIDGFRYGFYGVSDINPLVSALMLVVFAIIFTGINLHLLNKGTGIKS